MENQIKMKKCNRCGKEKPSTTEYFYSDKSKKDGLTTLCKACKNKKREVVYDDNDIGKIIDSNDTDKSGIYKIVNLQDNKIYIGSSVNLYGRYTEHISDLRNNKHDNNHLQNSFNKYGEENFKFYIQELVEDKNNLIDREQYWIDYYTSYDKKIGYNIRRKAESNYGLKMSDEAKQKVSLANKNRVVSLETRKKLSEIMIGTKRPKSKETIQKLSEAHKGKKFTEEHKNNLSDAKLKIWEEVDMTDEVKNKIRESNIGKNNPRYNIKISNEQILKYSKPVIQMDLEGNIIKEWISIGKTKEGEFDPSSVTSCCKGKLKKHKGFKWKYKYEKDIINEKFKIGQYKIVNNEIVLVNIWDNYKSVRDELNLNEKEVSECCRNLRKSYKGFIWKKIYGEQIV